MANSSYLAQEYLLYESPKIDVIEITAKDIVCASLLPDQSGTEGGTGANPGWGI